MNLAEFWTGVVMLVAGTSTCTLVTEFSSNRTVLFGNDATLLCTVKYQTEGTVVLWKKIDSGSIILTLNNKTTYRDKYIVANPYNLIIKSVQFQDEGLYECDTGEQRLTVALQVAVPMSNMSMYWNVPQPYQPNTFVNLTCVSINSRPPATLRWFRGAHEVTHASVNNNRWTRENGYGDSSSTLVGQVSSEDIPYVCIADLPDNPGVRTEFLFPSLIGAVNRPNSRYFTHVAIPLFFWLLSYILCL
ncbi:kin of IRRE-like protein 1 [Ostrea edulis]|uniref:kin of IRRE-like protein 1 n=1 Tax=Ostrea edulis TaxID=37623 RepID=UPI0024AF8E56|nr:kin of IRRE-like protein 1 [Ostrea edulis]